MKYTNKDINRILRIREFVETSNTLSKVYLDFDNKEYSIATFNDKDRIFKVYCSSIYNLIKAIKDDKQYFDKSHKYDEFDKLINEKFIAEKNDYFEDNHEETLFKILETIRHQSNHSRKDEDDNNLLFDAYIDFDIVDKLRSLTDEMFYEIFDTIDRKKLKEINISKPIIKYSFNRLKLQMEQVRDRVNDIDNEMNDLFKDDNNRALELFEKLFSAENIYDLLTKDKKALSEFDSADSEMQSMMSKTEKYVNEKGSDFEKEALAIIKEFLNDNDRESINEYNDRVNKLQSDLLKLKEKYNK